jgi:hypothetical protein
VLILKPMGEIVEQTDLIERGLKPEHSFLVVIDGTNALHKAVVEVFGELKTLPFSITSKCPTCADG